MAADVTGTTRICALIGDPVEHTMSPAMHNAAFSYLGIDYLYIPFKVAREYLPAAIEGMKALNFAGFNVTIPHKVAVMSLLDEVDTSAQRIGAVNTVIIQNGRTKGYNTDGRGFLQALQLENIEPANKRVVLLGAGGAARSIAFTLAEVNASLAILNRTKEKADALAADIERATGNSLHSGGLTGDVLKKTLSDAEILINTTSIGMSGSMGNSPVPSDLLNSGLVVCDVVYNPLETELLRQSKSVGCRTINGVGMLVHQGALAFNLWTGQAAPVDVMRKIVLARLRAQ